jgi:flagellar biosynthesis protein FliQ
MSIEGLIIILVAIGVGVAGQLAYYFIVNQELVRSSKTKMKELQAQIKQHSAPGDPQFKELYSQLMSENMKVMKQSLKPTFVTFVPFIIVFFIMSALFSYMPISTGSSVQAVLSGNVNGTLYFQNNCLTLNNSSNLTISASKLPLALSAVVKSSQCTAFLSQHGRLANTTLSGLVGSTQSKTYQVGNASISFAPNSLVVVVLPFSIPFIGSQITWFWAYLFFSLVSSLTLNRILIHYKLIA